MLSWLNPIASWMSVNHRQHHWNMDPSAWSSCALADMPWKHLESSTWNGWHSLIMQPNEDMLVRISKKYKHIYINIHIYIYIHTYITYNIFDTLYTVHFAWYIMMHSEFYIIEYTWYCIDYISDTFYIYIYAHGYLTEMFGFLMTQRYMYIYSSQTCPHSNGSYWWRDSLSTEPWSLEEEFHIFPVKTPSYTSNSSRWIFSIMSCVISQLAMFVHQVFCHS